MVIRHFFFALSILMLVFSNDVRTTVEGESIARTTSNVILLLLLFSSFARTRIFDAESSSVVSRNKEVEEEEEEDEGEEKESARCIFVALGRKKREKEKKNERNMHNRFDNQLEEEATAFNISPNERELLFAIQLVKYTIQ